MEVINERLQARYREIERNETRWEEIGVEGADYLMVAFGSVARICDKARELAAEKGIKVGIVRPITLWPFPTEAIAKAAQGKKGILCVELNAGQMIEDVRLAVHDSLPVEHFGRLGGIIPSPDEVLNALEQKIIKH
jgi:2-oxoglutarate ferredoxin oxidoreductase subunit alpha